MISLLTEKDIKKFILDEISKIDVRQQGCYPIYRIARKLSLDDQLVRYHAKKWKPEFYIGKRKYYNLEKAMQYFRDKGISIKYIS